MRRLSFPTTSYCTLIVAGSRLFRWWSRVYDRMRIKTSLFAITSTPRKIGVQPKTRRLKNPPKIPNTLPPKEYFLAEWGEPSETITVSEDEVTFVYKTVDIWCGVGVGYVFPVPLMAPTCEGFDRITFKGSKATHIHFKRRDATFLLLVFGGGIAAEKGKSCPIPCDIDIRE